MTATGAPGPDPTGPGVTRPVPDTSHLDTAPEARVNLEKTTDMHSAPDAPPAAGVTAADPPAGLVVEEPHGPALGTLVWGCTALAVAGLLGAWEVADVRVDVGLAVPVGMVTLGLLLVVGAVVAAVRRRS